MENENENIDSLNDENGSEDTKNVEDATALKEKIKDISDKNRQLFERAKKAEGFEKNAEGRWIKTQKPEVKEKSEAKPESQPDEIDYGKMAYLQTKGIDHQDDIKLVENEAKRLKLPITEILNMDYIKSKLATNKETREAQAGLPHGSKRAGGVASHDVDYWLAKGGLPADQELAEKVVDARMGLARGPKFSDTMFNE